MATRIKITKLTLRQDNRVDLFGRGHRFKDLTLFDAADLFDVGIDPADLQVGIETPCSFYAYYTESEKLNQAGNPYLDVDYLEAIDRGNGHHAPESSGVASDAILSELRAIRHELSQVRALLDLRLLGGSALATGSAELPPQELDQIEPVEPAGPEEIAETETQAGGLHPLSDDQARRMFGSLAGPAIRDGKIESGQVNDLVRAASVIGWRDALGQLQALIGGEAVAA